MLSKDSAGVTFGQIEDVHSGQTWDLPIQTDKLTYPLWNHIRFSSDGDHVFIPVELALGCLLNEVNEVQNSKGRKRCFVLAVIDCERRKEVVREEVTGTDVIKFGWLTAG